MWRRLDTSGREAARLAARVGGWELAGAAVFIHDGQPCRLDYIANCDANWQTVSGAVSGWIGEQSIDVAFEVDAGRHWKVDGIEIPEIEGCIDLDLNFSPSTNLLPIRRLDLAIGQQAAVCAAWLRFPSFKFEALDQVYVRLDDFTYQYKSAGGRFVTDLTVNHAGFVVEYPNFWKSEV